MDKSEGEETIALHIRADKLPAPEREYRFHPVRKWRFDFCWPEHMLAVEFEGGIWTGGAHTRGKHFGSDMDKYNEAALMGYRVLRFDIDRVKDGRAIALIKTALRSTVGNR